MSPERILTLSFVMLCFLFTGCSQKQPVRVPEISVSEVEPLQEMIHPEFANWSQFGVGTKVVRRKEVLSPQGAVIVTTELRLADRSDKKVVIESQVTVERPNEPAEVNPSESVEYPASFQVPKGLTAHQFAAPSLKAKAVGLEARTLAETEYQAQVFEWQETNEAGPMSVKVWYCAEFPGRLLRQELNVTNHQVTNVEDVIVADIK